jgi:DNA-directed RNA polymerase specialized sigma24 family protein
MHPTADAQATSDMDTELVIRAQRGDQLAFDAIVELTYGRLAQVAYRMLRDRQLAEDATQAALVRIWRKLPRLRGPIQVRGLVVPVARERLR